MTCNIFISHSWKKSKDYYTIVEWLDESSLDWRNMSIPQHNPKDTNNDNELQKLIDNNIKEASIFLIISSMHISQSNNKWLNVELNIAKKYDKPIIAIKPRSKKIPTIIKNNAICIVNWNSDSLIKAIRKINCK